ncbi:aromatic ring-hydroxylating dioxygenase subunit alpha [Williamsia sp.]|uniref:aromatic ring-hydroxylating oxygenase subunit alpha n=1 Tax=Williamsia sp. TaxID=1872085 RepID=UPI002F940DFE
MARWPKPPEGSWTEHYPELGTAPVSYEDSISPEIYELERAAIFKRAWLNVGRVEQAPEAGSYYTKEIVAADASIVVVRGHDERVRAFHNICRHRGDKLVWNDFPDRETQGSGSELVGKRSGWRYDLDGALTFVPHESDYLDFDKSDYGLIPVHCDVWEGFVFVNFAAEPEQVLTEFLGPMITDLAGYPFDKLTSRWYYRSEVKANWKLYMDAFQEFYHAPVLHANQSPTNYAKAAAEAGFEAPHYQLDGPHRLVSTSGVKAWEMDSSMRKPIEDICSSGLFGPWAKEDLGEMPTGVNPGRCDPWGLDSFQLFPNFVILFWSQGWYLTYHYWPTSHNTHTFEGNIYFVPARTPSERVAQELAAASFKEFGLQDANTLEATQTMVESRAVANFVLNDQEILLRHLHKKTAEWIEHYQKQTAEA